MNYLYNFYVCWAENEMHAYNIPEFYEWRTSDTLEEILKAPIFKVDASVYEEILNNLDTLPPVLLSSSLRYALRKGTYAIVTIKHAFVLTDGMRAFAVDTCNYDFPLKKSKLHPTQEAEVVLLAHQLSPLPLSTSTEQKTEYPIKYRMLTRRERKLKDVLLSLIEEEKTGEKTKSEVLYICSEWDVNMYRNHSDLSKEELLDHLKQEVLSDWGPLHETILHLLARNHPHIKRQLFAEMSHHTIKKTLG